MEIQFQVIPWSRIWTTKFGRVWHFNIKVPEYKIQINNIPENSRFMDPRQELLREIKRSTSC
jgi:hypothetical protein